jgi:hypothetical protein
MLYARFWVVFAVFSSCLSVPAFAQISHSARLDIIRTVLSDQAAARIGLPFGTDGVEVSDTGQINQQKLASEIRKNGQSVEPGKVVTITDLTFDDRSITAVIDGGGKNKKSVFDRIQVGVGTGGGTVPVHDDPALKAMGSKVVLRFAKKVPPDLTPDQLRQLLDPVLDFNKHSSAKTGIDALPPEFQEAVKNKEARIGMDRATVLLALGRPNQRFRDDPSDPASEQWMYTLRGLRHVFVRFENNIVVQVKQFQ